MRFFNCVPWPRLSAYVVLTYSLLLPFSLSAWALDLLIVDQNNSPVANAVVAIPKGDVSRVEATTEVMDQVDSKFVPEVLAIRAGSSVVFPNSDEISHHVYSFSKPKRFEIKLYKGDPNRPISFDKAGVVSLGCNIHDSMIGHIFVSPWPTFTNTDVDGRATLEGNSDQVAIWHPKLKNPKKPITIDLKGGDSASQHKLVIKLAKQKKQKRKRKKHKIYK